MFLKSYVLSFESINLETVGEQTDIKNVIRQFDIRKICMNKGIICIKGIVIRLHLIYLARCSYTHTENLCFINL